MLLTDISERFDVLGRPVGVDGAVRQVAVYRVLGLVLQRVHRVRHPADDVLRHRRSTSPRQT